MKRLSVIGNITQDAEVKDAGARKAINFSIAHNEKYKNQQGEKAEKTTYFNCVIWREENVKVAEFLTKGTKVLIEGNPEVEVYKDKNGDYKGGIKIIVSEVEFLSSLKQQNQETQRTAPAPDKDFGSGTKADDDLPF